MRKPADAPLRTTLCVAGHHKAARSSCVPCEFTEAQQHEHNQLQQRRRWQTTTHNNNNERISRGNEAVPSRLHVAIIVFNSDIPRCRRLQSVCPRPRGPSRARGMTPAPRRWAAPPVVSCVDGRNKTTANMFFGQRQRGDQAENEGSIVRWASEKGVHVSSQNTCSRGGLSASPPVRVIAP